MNKEIIKKYQKEDLTIIWKPKLCIHSSVCVKELPEVYNPKEKPWIKAEMASIEELRSQIEKCPSNALSYTMKNTSMKEKPQIMETKIEVTKNGPLLVYGHLEVIDTEGKIEKKKRTTAFCRCGASNNKPYCDGAHQLAGFEG
ncbi:MAG: (4Fe-4S)-binding protein [Flavobacteriaceae bacterium]